MDAEQVLGPFIDGLMRESTGDSEIDIINPSNGQRVLSATAGSEADVDRAVSSSRFAFEDGRWSDSPPSFRKRVLHRIADLIASEADALDALDAAEMGKPVGEPVCNATTAASLMHFYAEASDKVMGDVYVSDKHSLVAQRRVPRGVVAAVVPWNFPTYVAVLKIAPALAAGNCVVLKPSELSPRSALRLADIAMRAELPPGVLNVVPGLGTTVGSALGLHRGVDMLTFTGSTGVGKLMLQYAGQSNLKVVLAECGGKSPHIVFSDSIDLAAVAQAIARMLVLNQGQVCSLGSRLLVERSCEEELLAHLTAQFSNIVMGDALNPSTTFGPLSSEKQCKRVMRYIELGHSDGAQLVSGGRRVLCETGGYFIEPTVFRAVPPTAKIAQEEIFGPVLSVLPFDDDTEAVRIANGTPFGLAAYVWTKDLSRGMRMARGIRSSVRINATAPNGEGAGFAASYEPTGQSGVGCEGGVAGMESYLRRQRIWLNHG